MRFLIGRTSCPNRENARFSARNEKKPYFHKARGRGDVFGEIKEEEMGYG